MQHLSLKIDFYETLHIALPPSPPKLPSPCAFGRCIYTSASTESPTRISPFEPLCAERTQNVAPSHSSPHSESLVFFGNIFRKVFMNKSLLSFNRNSPDVGSRVGTVHLGQSFNCLKITPDEKRNTLHLSSSNSLPPVLTTIFGRNADIG